MKITINGRPTSLPERLRDARLLDVLRDVVGLKGTKYGCGIGLCGACTLHVDGEAVRACQISAGEVVGRQVTTIEGLADTRAGEGLHPLQRAWIAEAVPQCGYCQPGQIMAAAAFLQETPNPSDAEIRRAMSGNLCRCGTYVRIRRAVARAAREARDAARG